MILIKNGKIITMTGENYENGCVLIDDGKIINVDKYINELDIMEVIDAQGGWVIPELLKLIVI